MCHPRAAGEVDHGAQHRRVWLRGKLALWGVVGDAEIASLLARQPLAEAGRTLVDVANEIGGPGNITVQIVHTPAGSVSGGSRGRAALAWLKNRRGV